MPEWLIYVLEFASDNPLISTVIGGLLVAFITFIFRHLFEFGRTSPQAIPKQVNDVRISNNSNSTVNIAEKIVINHSIEPERESRIAACQEYPIARRLKQFLQIINEHSLKKTTIYQLSQLVGDKDPNSLARYFNSEELPSFEYVEKLCHAFSLNADWIWNGNGGPFSQFDIDPTYPSSSFASITESQPQHIYFILSNNPEREVAIILQYSDLSYQQSSYQWHLSLDHVGNTGQSQIVSLYKLICRLYNEYGTSCTDYEVPKKAWNDLLEGKLWPGSFSRGPVRSRLKIPSHWADDLRDLDHRYAPDYEKLYGNWFVRTQEFIKNQLQHEKDVGIDLY